MCEMCEMYGASGEMTDIAEEANNRFAFPFSRYYKLQLQETLLPIQIISRKTNTSSMLCLIYESYFILQSKYCDSSMT